MDRGELLQGTLDVLVLRALQDERRHGFGVQRRLRELSGGHLNVEEGSLYPALYRMERRGWITSTWGRSENNRRARYYRITALGRRQLAEQAAGWQEFSASVNRVLGDAT